MTHHQWCLDKRMVVPRELTRFRAWAPARWQAAVFRVSVVPCDLPFALGVEPRYWIDMGALALADYPTGGVAVVALMSSSHSKHVRIIASSDSLSTAATR